VHRLHVIAFALLLAPLVFVACGGDSDPAPVRTVRITLGGSGCNPSSLNFATGRVRFVVSNPGSSNVTAFEVRSERRSLGSVNNVIGGTTRNLTVTFDEAGAYSMRCSGREIDGSGVIVITERPSTP
jgi:plastocyanin